MAQIQLREHRPRRVSLAAALALIYPKVCDGQLLHGIEDKMHVLQPNGVRRLFSSMEGEARQAAAAARRIGELLPATGGSHRTIGWARRHRRHRRRRRWAAMSPE